MRINLLCSPDAVLPVRPDEPNDPYCQHYDDHRVEFMEVPAEDEELITRNLVLEYYN